MKVNPGTPKQRLDLEVHFSTQAGGLGDRTVTKLDNKSSLITGQPCFAPLDVSKARSLGDGRVS